MKRLLVKNIFLIKYLQSITTLILNSGYNICLLLVLKKFKQMKINLQTLLLQITKWYHINSMNIKQVKHNASILQNIDMCLLALKTLLLIEKLKL